MTPGARAQTAIEILDQVLTGAPAEQSLTAWARRSRFAGSGDRAAVRDHVFDALRCLRSCAAAGGQPTSGLAEDPATSGRALILGLMRLSGEDPDRIFTGEGYAPPPLTDAERAGGASTLDALSPEDQRDLPDWLWPLFRDSLGDDAEAAARALRQRAQVHLRVNTRKTDRAGAIARLAGDGIEAEPHPAADTALRVTEGARRIRNAAAFTDGLVELQDAASQAVCAALPLSDGLRVLDYCAGGGGKTLAMAGRANLKLFAHDADPRRMRDLPKRAARAGVEVTCLESADLAAAGPFDLVLCDAPCSGSGAWRRSPEAKWRLTPDRLEKLQATQSEILCDAANLVARGGHLAYATCSVLSAENNNKVHEFVEENFDWKINFSRSWGLIASDGTPDSASADGFHLSTVEYC
ncbi:RsmB/NOP family class I SAM-dependent RNA methyltransferase [Chachezhania antarctica]|uniref:RsmB/NOP family class I SAM-dependent RNA methyltransferase n=1 Tax=Chachezhania antarctica TaxID=2340860 RepID=UPI000EAF35F8|nr:RsmB/NOP family class I SAM-dependent RNA methyltransferase [Chachezhania antarctica]|tara:strand:- start:7664 stop:8893 length:1230 start_codon:yes stop_codon:yes gene_type:complete